jgi:hypothetical protein
LVILYVVVFGLGIYAARLISNSLPMEVTGFLFQPRTLWEFIAYLGSWLNFGLLSLCGVFLITTDWTHRTLRQSVIFGMTRNEVGTAKLLTSAVLAAGATLVYCIASTVASLLIKLPFPDTLPPMDVVVRFYGQAFGCLLFGLVVGLFVRQTAGATLLVLAYLFVAEAIGRWVLLFTVFPTRALLFLPDHVLENLTRFPIPEAVNSLARRQELVAPLSALEIGLAAAVWILLGITVVYWRLRRVDL